jgi:antirestriction protein ArdC
MTQVETQSQVNIKTGKAYYGPNAELLTKVAEEKGYASNEWGTMKQWNSENEVIRKGEKSTKITFMDKRKGEEVIAPLFNRSQLD